MIQSQRVILIHIDDIFLYSALTTTDQEKHDNRLFDWFISLSLMISIHIHFVAKDRNSFSFMAE